MQNNQLYNTLDKEQCELYNRIRFETINFLTNLTKGKAALGESAIMPNHMYDPYDSQGADKGDHCNEDVETCRQFFVGSVRITGRKRDHLLMIFV